MYNYVINSFAGMKSNECLELEHLIHQAFELSTAFLKDRKLFGQNGRLLIVLFFKMFTNHWIFMLLNAQMEVAARETNIIRIARAVMNVKLYFLI